MDKILLVLPLLLSGALCDIPTDLTVANYALSLKVPSSPNTAVEGTVVITLNVVADTNVIVLHWGSSLSPSAPKESDGLTSITYTTPGTTPTTTTVTGYTQTLLSGKLTITTTQPSTQTAKNFLTGGTIIVTATFTTKINADNKGLFYRQYLENNQNYTIYMTNLRPTFARELFPCLDEPQFHGPLTLTLAYPTSWGFAATAEAVTPSGGASGTVFNQVNIPANTFALFLAENMAQMGWAVDRSTTKLSFWSRKGLASNVFSANVQFLAQYYYLIEDVLGIDLGLTQLNVVMVPGLEEPFAGYGVIFIREYNYAQDYTSPQMEGLFRANVAPVVHQFIRQFTEFSTRPWKWSDYWVSQALAKYLQYTVLNTLMPIFDFKTDLEVVARQTALALDSQIDATPLQYTVDADSPASVQALVTDPLKGLKGSYILNMLDQALPAGTVFTAIKSFLNTNKDKTLQDTTTVFSKAIQDIGTTVRLSPGATASLTTTLGYWFTTTRYPLEAVKVFRAGTPGTVNFTTTGFCSAVNPSCVATLPEQFYVPVTVGTKSDNRYYSPRQDLWANNKDAYIDTSINVADTDWVVANMKSGGYYRSSYDADNWGYILSAISSGDNRLMGRTQILDDAFALALSSTGPLDYNTTVKLALANLGNTLYRDWVPVQRGLRGIQDNLLGLSTYSSYKNFAAGFFLNLNGFLQNRSSDPFEKAKIQALFLDDFCEYDIAGYRASAVSNLTDMLKGTLPNTVPSSAYDAVACCGARNNPNLKAQTLWNTLNDYTQNYYSRRFASVALGCLSNYTDIAQMYNTMTVANIQLKPYIVTALQNVAEKNPVNFLADISLLADKFQNQLGAASVGSLILRAGRKVNNVTQANVLNSLTNANVDALVIAAAKITTDAVGYRVTWHTKNGASLITALQTHTLPSGTTSGANVFTGISLLVFLPSLLFVLVPLCVQ